VCFALLSIVPVLELMVLRTTGLWSVAWYHGFIAVIGVAALGGYGWKALAERLPRWALVGTGAGVVGASLALVVMYFTTAHGDRPRWNEAAAVLRDHGVTAATTDVDVRSDAPGVVAYYVGVPAAETMGHPLVRRPSWPVAPDGSGRERWFVLEQRLIPRESRRWLDESCQRRAAFPAFFVTRDRTVLVYDCPSSQPRSEAEVRIAP
jgi:hypothetical protein